MAEQGLNARLGLDATDFERSIKNSENKLKDFGTTAVNTGTKVNRTTSSFIGLNQVLRDSGNFAISAQIGLLSISNNLPTLIDDFGRFKKQLEDVRGTSVSTGSALRSFAGSFIGSGGLVALIGVAATAIPILIGRFLQARDAAKKAKDEFKSVNDILAGAQGSTLTQNAQISALIGIFGDLTKSTQQRKRALEELRDINRAYFGDLEFEKTTTGELTKRQNELNGALVQQAIIKGAQSEIEKLGLAYAKARENAINATRALRQAQDALPKVDANGVRIFTISDDLTNLSIAANKANTEFNKIKTQVDEYLNIVNNATIANTDFRNTTASSTAAVKKQAEAYVALGGEIQKVFRNRDINFSDLSNPDALKAFESLPKKVEKTINNQPITYTPRIILGPEALKNIQALDQLKERVNNVATAFDQFLTPVINTAFEALGNGTSIFKAIGQSLKALVVQLGITIVKSAILSAILSSIGGGPGLGLANGAGFGAIFSKLFNGALGIGNVAAPNFAGVGGGGLAVTVGGQFNVRGTDLVAVVSQGNQRIGRVG